MAWAPAALCTSGVILSPWELRISAASFCRVRSGRSPFISKACRWEAHICLHSSCLDQVGRYGSKGIEAATSVRITNPHTHTHKERKTHVHVGAHDYDTICIKVLTTLPRYLTIHPPTDHQTHTHMIYMWGGVPVFARARASDTAPAREPRCCGPPGKYDTILHPSMPCSK